MPPVCTESRRTAGGIVFACRGGGMPRDAEFYTQKQVWSCLHPRGRWLDASQDGGSVPGSMGHSLCHTLQRDRPLREGPRDGALPEAATALIRHGYAMPLRNGMTATGSHVYFYSLRGAQPPGEGFFSVPGGFCADFYCSIIAVRRAGHAHAPTMPRRGCVPDGEGFLKGRKFRQDAQNMPEIFYT